MFEYLGGGRKENGEWALSKFITDILPLADNESIPGTSKTAVEAEIISFCCIQLSEAAINLPTCSPELSMRRGGRASAFCDEFREMSPFKRHFHFECEGRGG